MNRVDLTVVVVYLGAMIGLGCWLARRSGSTSQFMTAGGSLSGWAVGLSIFGTYVSSISFLANPGKSFSGNWNGWVFGLSLPLVAWLAAKYFVPFYRNHGHISAYAHLEERFGGWARTYAAICYLLTQLARMGTIMYLVALGLQPLTGWEVRSIIMITGLLVTTYTMLGGIEAVIRTDAIQSVVLTIGAVLCLGLILWRLPEGPGQVFEIARGQGKFSLGSLSPDLTQSTFWVVLLFGFVINLQNFGIDQSYVQRYHTAVDERAAVHSVWIGALLYLPISGLLFFIGTALFAFYGQYPELGPEAVDGVVKADAYFPHFIATQLPAGMTGLLVAAIFAAAMSSVDSSLNSSATLILEDFVKRYFCREPTERTSMLVLYTTTLVLGVGGTGAALLMIHIQGALDAWWQLSGIFAGGMLGLFLMGMIARHARRPAAVTAVVCGVAVICWATFSPGWSKAKGSLQVQAGDVVTVTNGLQLVPGDRIVISDGEQFWHRRADAIQRIQDAAADRQRMTIDQPIAKDIPHADVYYDNFLYTIRNPLHNLLTIVLGTMTILLVGLTITRLADRRR